MVGDEMTCEPCTYLPDTEGDCLQTSSLDTRQLSLLSGMDMPAKSSENAPPMDGSPACECGKGTLGCLIHPSTPEAWTAYMRDSLAKTLALLESRQAYLRELGQVFTAKSCASLAWYDPSNSSWKTYQQSFLTDSEPYSETWPRWGMTVDGSAYAHPMSECRITETDGLHWPTPTASQARSEGGILQMRGLVDAGILAEEEAEAMIAGSLRPKRMSIWPTPTAHNAKETNAKREMNRNTPTLAAQVGGKLNPTWVEWLMGFPIGFTVSKDWVTPKSRSKQPSHGNYSEASE